MIQTGNSVRLEILSRFDMLDFVQLVTDQMARLGGLDGEATHWVGVAVRESAINAIKHGNREDESKLVTIEFAFEPLAAPIELVVRILDQGEGFDVDCLADPLTPENILKASGRGIFFMRSFMDDMSIQRAPQGGMEVRMVKRLGATLA